jgi:RNA polymerase sigma factor (sigma-70 family)
MKATTQLMIMPSEQNEQITAAIQKEKGRLLNFIRSRVSSDEDAEDILQDVFSQLVETYRLMKPIEQVSAWLFTVARNKITDLFRKKKAIPFSRQNQSSEEEGETLFFEDLLVSEEGGPEDDFARTLVINELDAALEQLPREQKEVFLMHEFEGLSFKEIAEKTGKPVNTLISRKRYAVLSLREHLNELYNDFLNN